MRVGRKHHLRYPSTRRERVHSLLALRYPRLPCRRPVHTHTSLPCRLLTLSITHELTHHTSDGLLPIPPNPRRAVRGDYSRSREELASTRTRTPAGYRPRIPAWPEYRPGPIVAADRVRNSRRSSLSSSPLPMAVQQSQTPDISPRSPSQARTMRHPAAHSPPVGSPAFIVPAVQLAPGTLPPAMLLARQPLSSGHPAGGYPLTPEA